MLSMTLSIIKSSSSRKVNSFLIDFSDSILKIVIIKMLNNYNQDNKPAKGSVFDVNSLFTDPNYSSQTSMVQQFSLLGALANKAQSN